MQKTQEFDFFKELISLRYKQYLVLKTFAEEPRDNIFFISAQTHSKEVHSNKTDTPNGTSIFTKGKRG